MHTYPRLNIELYMTLHFCNDFSKKISKVKHALGAKPGILEVMVIVTNLMVMLMMRWPPPRCCLRLDGPSHGTRLHPDPALVPAPGWIFLGQGPAMMRMMNRMKKRMVMKMRMYFSYVCARCQKAKQSRRECSTCAEKLARGKAGQSKALETRKTLVSCSKSF